MATILEALTIAAQHLEAGRFQAVEEICGQVLAREPEQADARHMLGVLAYRMGNYEVAVEHICRAISVRETQAAFYVSLGICLREQRNLDSAICSFRRALELEPGNAVTHVNLGNVLQNQMRHGEAVGCYERALELNPSDPQASNNLANALRNLGRYGEAMASFDRAIALRGDYASAHCGRAMLRLMVGDFENGWPEYEWRWRSRQAARREFSAPGWNGEDLGTRTILLYDEQGFGDTFQFVRYGSLVKDRNPLATVVCECQRPLVNALAGYAGVDRFVARRDELPALDCQAALLSLPAILHTTVETIAARIPYLSAESALVVFWRERLRPVEGFRVGINWYGRPGAEAFSRRNVPLESLAPLAAVPGVKLISLQAGEGREELRAAIEQGLPIVDLGEELDGVHGAFMDTAAVMMNLDLVISSDTSVPHLAGALGVPVWVALPFTADWRWLVERADSPWYPTMRLFRQTVAGDWQHVVGEMASELRKVASFVS